VSVEKLKGLQMHKQHITNASLNVKNIFGDIEVSNDEDVIKLMKDSRE
jgi:hypothetical protein